MKSIKYPLIALLGFTINNHAFAENALDDLRENNYSKNEWRLSKHDKRHDIKVYIKNEDGQKIRSFKVEALLDTNIETLSRIQSDIENYSRWYFATLETKLLKKVSDKEYIFYMVHDAPYGNPDRDVIMRAVIEPMTKKRPYVQIKMEALPTYLPVIPPYVRMEAENYIARWTPVGNNQVLLEAEGFVNPGGNAPSWTVNFIQGRGPYANMMGLRRMINLPKYNEAQTPIPFTFVE
ncbi:MAG TPA: hypothetical protein PLW01_05880 [Agitococcus sp.]|nr:hypothetical protein [Agitococcus sp.]